MIQPPRVLRADPARPDEPGGIDAVESTQLMNGKRELLIRHGGETYRLRVTASNKLILTK
jgi:hemin uptake protein HemP